MVFQIFLIDILKLFSIYILGTFIIREDIRNGRIPNNLLMIMFCCGLFFWVMARDYIHATNFLLNFLFSACLALVVWYANLWPAGDAKLFLALSMLLPTQYYQTAFPSLSFLLIILLLIFLLLTSYSIFRTNLKEKKLAAKYVFEKSNILKVTAFVFAFQWVINTLFSFFGLPQNFLLTILFLFFIFEIIERITPNVLYISIFFGVLRIFFEIESVLSSYYFWIQFVILVMEILIVYYLIVLGYYCFTEYKKIDDLKVGDILAEDLAIRGKRIVGVPFVAISLFAALRRKRRMKVILDANPAGITSREINYLKTLSERYGLSSVRVQKTIPFSPILLSGAIVVYLVHIV